MQITIYKGEKMEKYYKLKNNLEKFGLILITKEHDFKSVKQLVTVSDGQYYASVKAENYINNDKKKNPIWFAIKNPYILYNINKYLEIRFNGNFKCISNQEDIITKDSILEFKCTRCGKIIKKSLYNLRRNDE